MRMIMRWFGEDNDTVTLEQIKQIPGVEGVAWSLHKVPAGEEWMEEEIFNTKRKVEKFGLNIDVVESVNVHEDIKLGLSSREKYIVNFIKTIEKLAKAGVKVICYNFMPVFDWTRTELFKKQEDGSTALFFENSKIKDIEPMKLVEMISKESSYTMPGWEPERLDHLSRLFEQYKLVTEEDLWDNLQYFLERIIPVAKENDVKMAIHPDDPPWSVFGLPRIITNSNNLRRFLSLVDDPYNGITLCSGSLGSNPNNNVEKMVREFSGRIHFAHVRNVKTYENGNFIETSHRTKDGSVDITNIVKAYHETGYSGYVRPDHGRHIWDETSRPGYGLYDRALGIMYLWGLWDSLESRV
ncbi:mannonate dehydratase [Virgibacillus ihumii]|uniref:mannonate dehydratase n=1 Tax=Virgibacillus ihumii TaxID=2686091 RepID=UPI00157D60B8|nr:mannonate dehydratase [Virgibacillus ihumii]